MVVVIRLVVALEVLNVVILSLSYVGLFLSGFVLHPSEYNMLVSFCGMGIWFFGLILAFTPNFVFKKHGGVPKGKSYVNTTKLVDSGVYSLLRHPQYTGGFVIACSIPFLVQHLLVFPLVVVALVTTYLSMVFEDRRLVDKFGDDYVEYQQKVPRMNFLIGLFRKIRS